MEELFNQLITTGLGLGLLGGAYLVWLMTGVANNLFNDKKWSWKRMGEDILKTLLMCIALIAWVCLCAGLEWFSAMCGCDISALMDGASVVGVLGGLIGGTTWYMVKAYKNILAFINANHVEVVVENPDYKGIADAVKDTITSLFTTRELLEQDGIAVEEANVKLEDEAGKGGFTNTYPEPYRSAAKDSLVDPSSCFSKECVSYCAWKICETTGSWPRRTGDMNAKEWVNRLPSWGYNKVSAPKEGGKYVGVSTLGTYGHVIWFETGNTISEYNYADLGNYNVRDINLANYAWYEIKAPETAPEPTPEPAKTETGFKVGDTVVPTRLVDYNGTKLTQYDKTYVITQLNGNRAVLSALRANESIVWAAMDTADIALA